MKAYECIYEAGETTGNSMMKAKSNLILKGYQL